MSYYIVCKLNTTKIDNTLNRFYVPVNKRLNKKLKWSSYYEYARIFENITDAEIQLEKLKKTQENYQDLKIITKKIAGKLNFENKQIRKKNGYNNIFIPLEEYWKD